MTPQEPRHTAATRRTRQGGFTLAEGLIASVFLAVAVVGVAGSLVAASQQAHHATDSSTAQSLANELMEEIISKSFTTQSNAGWSAGATNRATYDDAADYNGYTDNTTAGIKSLQGTTISLGDNTTYTRTATFEYRTTPGGSSQSSGDFGMARVTVTSGSGVSITVQRLLTNPVLVR